MDGSNGLLIAGILIGVIQIVLILSVVRISESAKEMQETLNSINYKLEEIKGSTSRISASSGKSSTTDNSWVCRCGARNYGSKTCSKCGAKKGED